MAKKKATSKKPAARKKSPARRRPAAPRGQRVEKVTGGVVVGGDIKAGRDVVMHDQINIRDNRQQTAQIGTSQELVAELHKLRAEIAALKQSPELDETDAQLVKVVEARVVEAAEAAAKPEPDKGKVITALAKANTTMAALGAGVTTAIGLGEAIGKVGPYLGQVLEAARRLFGLG